MVNALGKCIHAYAFHRVIYDWPFLLTWHIESDHAFISSVTAPRHLLNSSPRLGYFLLQLLRKFELQQVR